MKHHDPVKSIDFLGCKANIYHGHKDDSISVNGKVRSFYSGPTSFDYSLIDFNNCFSKTLSSSIPKAKRIYKENKNLKIVGLTDSLVLDSIDQISQIANTKIEEVQKKGLDYVYRRNLANICIAIYKMVGDKKDAEVIVPLRGGALVASLVPIKKSRIIPIDCKRLPFKSSKNHLGFGMRLYYDSVKKGDLLSKRVSALNNKSIRIMEVCVASGMTTAGILLDLDSRGIKVKDVEIIAPVIAQQGYEFVMKVAKHLGINVSFATGAVFYRLGNFYNELSDSLLTDDGRYVVGKATTILRSFLPSYIT